jgi:hypothetical protein
VPTLARGDVERLLRFVSAADEIAAEEPFTPETLAAVGEVVAADYISYSELDRVRARDRLKVEGTGRSVPIGSLTLATSGT